MKNLKKAQLLDIIEDQASIINQRKGVNFNKVILALSLLLNVYLIFTISNISNLCL